jgi:hypothetical protein
MNRIRSSRKLEQEAVRNIEVIWLLKKLRPDFKTIADFRKDNKKSLKNLFRDFNKLCSEWDLFGKETVAIDGSKFRASNSKKNNFSEKKIKRQLKYLEEKMEKYMQELELGDDAENGIESPKKEKVEAILKDIKNRKIKYEEMEKELVRKETKEISTIDPDARLMSSNNNGVDVSYNVQSTVDSKHKLVADFKVTSNPNDIGELDNMALRAKKLFGTDKLEVLADKGYYKADDLKKCVSNGIEPYVTHQVYANGTGNKDFYSDKFTYDKDKKVYICPIGMELKYSRLRKDKSKNIIGYEYKNYKACTGCEFKSRCTKSKNGRSICRHVDQDFLDQINLKTDEQKEKYKQRQMIVEHPFGTIKRGWGMNYFLMRGKFKVAAEMALAFLTYNMKRAISVLGTKEIIRKLKERRKIALV